MPSSAHGLSVGPGGAFSRRGPQWPDGGDPCGVHGSAYAGVVARRRTDRASLPATGTPGSRNACSPRKSAGTGRGRYRRRSPGMSGEPPLTCGPPRVRAGWSTMARATTCIGCTTTSGGISSITPIAHRSGFLIRAGRSWTTRNLYRDAVTDTRQRLIEGAIETIRRHGLACTSARSIATTAGVNQALVFYHFGSVHDLLQAACLATTQARVESFAERLDQVTDLRQLLALGRALHTEERAQGNVMVLAQMLAGAAGLPQDRRSHRGSPAAVDSPDQARPDQIARRLARGRVDRHGGPRMRGGRWVRRAGAVRGS